jgi:hypothetical protein
MPFVQAGSGSTEMVELEHLQDGDEGHEVEQRPRA